MVALMTFDRICSAIIGALVPVMVRAGSVFWHRSGPLINIDPAWARVKLGPIIETEGEAHAKAY